MFREGCYEPLHQQRYRVSPYYSVAARHVSALHSGDVFVSDHMCSFTRKRTWSTALHHNHQRCEKRLLKMMQVSEWRGLRAWVKALCVDINITSHLLFH